MKRPNNTKEKQRNTALLTNQMHVLRDVEDRKRAPLTASLLAELYAEFNGDGPRGRAVHAPDVRSVSLDLKRFVFTYQWAKSVGELAEQTGLSRGMVHAIIDTYPPTGRMPK